MSLPSSVSLPAEMQLGSLDYSLPPEARSYQVKVQPSNVSSIVSPDIAIAAGLEGTDLPFPSQQIIFDIPCGSSPSTFLDNRFTTLNFTATYAVGATVSTSVAITSANLRSNANSFFDRMYITSQNGQILEDITEYGLVNDLLINFQMNNAVRDGVAMQFGFDDASGNNTSQGHTISAFNGRVAAASNTCSYSYSVPILSGLIGALSDKMLNVGRTSKLQLILQSSSVLPVTFVNTTASNAASSVKVTLANFSITCEYIDIGGSALKMLDQTLVNNQAYIHGVSYRVTSNTIPAGTSGNLSLLAGIRNSSVKSIFVKYVDNLVNSLTNGSVNSKFDGKNPSINSWAISVGGMRYPSNPLNPLLQPSQAFSECEKAIGSFNNAQFQSCITRARYCKLARGGTTPAESSTSTDRNYSLSSSATAQCQFFMAYCLEVCAKRGLLSGLNCSSAPVFVENNLAVSCTNAQLIYVIAMIDCIFIHDVSSGDISVRL